MPAAGVRSLRRAARALRGDAPCGQCAALARARRESLRGRPAARIVNAPRELGEKLLNAEWWYFVRGLGRAQSRQLAPIIGFRARARRRRRRARHELQLGQSLLLYRRADGLSDPAARADSRRGPALGLPAYVFRSRRRGLAGVAPRRRLHPRPALRRRAGDARGERRAARARGPFREVSGRTGPSCTGTASRVSAFPSLRAASAPTAPPTRTRLPTASCGPEAGPDSGTRPVLASRHVRSRRIRRPSRGRPLRPHPDRARARRLRPDPQRTVTASTAVAHAETFQAAGRRGRRSGGAASPRQRGRLHGLRLPPDARRTAPDRDQHQCGRRAAERTPHRECSAIRSQLACLCSELLSRRDDAGARSSRIFAVGAARAATRCARCGVLAIADDRPDEQFLRGEFELFVRSSRARESRRRSATCATSLGRPPARARRGAGSISSTCATPTGASRTRAARALREAYLADAAGRDAVAARAPSAGQQAAARALLVGRCVCASFGATADEIAAAAAR